ncbi:MAG: LysM-like peptidoglycan-binding domain-containing protein [Vibrio gallaecicus]|uniref:LysM-like peptidoglycan-binding domain-containing protein n=1 Tax=Vibrio gallaecicus TaxID=552386 RepID=A0ABV4N9S9_9VIBR
MNRRQKKKQKVDHLASIKDKLSAVDVSQVRNRIAAFWALLPSLHRKLLLVLAPIVIILFFIPVPEASKDPQEATSRVELEISTVGLSEQAGAKQQPLQSNDWREYLVQQGDTLAQVFRNNKLSQADLNALVKIEGQDKPLSQIRKGQLVRFKLQESGQLDILQLEKGTSSVMFFRLSDGGFGRSK